MAQRCTYTGTGTRTYPQYRDVDTGRSLVAVPGETFELALIDPESKHPIPPDDGNWKAAKSKASTEKGGEQQ